VIAEIIIIVGSLDEAVTFYTETVGLDYLRRVRVDDATVVMLGAGGTRVSLLEGPTPSVRVVFTSDDIGVDHRRLVRRGTPMPIEPTRARGGTVLPFTDPWGNALAFWETS